MPLGTHAEDAPATLCTITVSLVSHGHDRWLLGLLEQIARTGAGMVVHVIVVHNLPPAHLAIGSGGWPFRITQIENDVPAGFGANHNRAFRLVDTEFFCVLNPDISLPSREVWAALVRPARHPTTGCAYPVLMNSDGSRQDNARATPTPWALLRRRLLHLDDLRVDWASAAFWLLPSAVFRYLDGFDERYYMYCEDVDFCLRLRAKGLSLVAAVDAVAVHDAQRQSHRTVRHLWWHLHSLGRLWTRLCLAGISHGTSNK